MADIRTTNGIVKIDGTSITAVNGSVLTVGSIPASKLAQSGATSNQAIIWNGSAWAPATPTASVAGTTVEVDLGSTPKTSGRFTITDASISATSKVLVWQASGPYTGKGTLADEAAMQPVNIVAVASGSGSCTVWWETPPMVVVSPVVPDGKRDAPSTAAGFDPRYPNVQHQVHRIGKVKGNVKFSYAILA